jgi:hypothetical protein
MTKIDTQGLTGPADPNDDKQSWKYADGYPPMPVATKTLFTDTFKKELKELINEVLDEREKRYYDKEDDSWLYRGTY